MSLFQSRYRLAGGNSLVLVGSLVDVFLGSSPGIFEAQKIFGQIDHSELLSLVVSLLAANSFSSILGLELSRLPFPRVGKGSCLAANRLCFISVLEHIRLPL